MTEKTDAPGGSPDFRYSHYTPFHHRLGAVLLADGFTQSQITGLTILIWEIHYCLGLFGETEVQGGRRWTLRTYDQLLAKFPGLPGPHTVRRVVAAGRRAGIILTERASRGLYYALDYDHLGSLFDKHNLAVPTFLWDDLGIDGATLDDPKAGITHFVEQELIASESLVCDFTGRLHDLFGLGDGDARYFRNIRELSLDWVDMNDRPIDPSWADALYEMVKDADLNESTVSATNKFRVIMTLEKLGNRPRPGVVGVYESI